MELLGGVCSPGNQPLAECFRQCMNRPRLSGVRHAAQCGTILGHPLAANRKIVGVPERVLEMAEPAQPVLHTSFRQECSGAGRHVAKLLDLNPQAMELAIGWLVANASAMVGQPSKPVLDSLAQKLGQRRERPAIRMVAKQLTQALPAMTMRLGAEVPLQGAALLLALACQRIHEGGKVADLFLGKQRFVPLTVGQLNVQVAQTTGAVGNGHKVSSQACRRLRAKDLPCLRSQNTGAAQVHAVVMQTFRIQIVHHALLVVPAIGEQPSQAISDGRDGRGLVTEFSAHVRQLRQECAGGPLGEGCEQRRSRRATDRMGIEQGSDRGEFLAVPAQGRKAQLHERHSAARQFPALNPALGNHLAERVAQPHLLAMTDALEAEQKGPCGVAKDSRPKRTLGQDPSRQRQAGRPGKSNTQ